jgi:hypothetical protein
VDLRLKRLQGEGGRQGACAQVRVSNVCLMCVGTLSQKCSLLVDLYRKCTRALTHQNLCVDAGVAGGGDGGEGGEGGGVMDVEEGGASSPASSPAPYAGGSQQEGSSLPAVSSNSVSSGMSADEQIAVDALNPDSLRQSSLISGDCSGPVMNNLLTNPSLSQFEMKARDGGNFTSKRVSSLARELKLDADKLAMWTPKKGYEAKICVLKAFLERPQLDKDTTGILHPILRISSVKMHADVRRELVEKTYGHVAHPELCFRQFLSAMGIRSQIIEGNYMWQFDPEAWNRVGYRLVSGCHAQNLAIAKRLGARPAEGMAFDLSVGSFSDDATLPPY